MDLNNSLCDTAGDNSAMSMEMLPNSASLRANNAANNFYFGDFSVSNVQRPTIISNFESPQQQMLNGGGGGGGGGGGPNPASNQAYAYWQHQQASATDNDGGRSPNSAIIDSLTSSSQQQQQAITAGRGASAVQHQRQVKSTGVPAQQHQQQVVHPPPHASNLAGQLRRSPVPRPYGYESSQGSASNPLGMDQQQQQQFLFDDLFPATSSALGLMSRPGGGNGGGGLDPRFVEFTQQHQQQQQQANVSGMRSFMMDGNAQGFPPPPPMDFLYAEPWEELWGGVDTSNAAVYGAGHPLVHQRPSLSHDQFLFQQRQGVQSGNGAASAYMSQAPFDGSRRPMVRQEVSAQGRSWVPSQLGYDASSAMAAPPRTIAARSSLTPAAPPNRKSQSRSDDGERKKPKVAHSPMAGENRLKITFVSLGTAGESAQHFGTKGFIIPDGLSGMHQVYHQRWRFDIKHHKVEDTIVVSWGITNLASGTTCQRTETPREAKVRETSGHTICNQLLRQALKTRASELEMQLNSLRENPTKYSNTETLIKALRPKSCILGLLFFGLLHDTVQQRMRDMLGITQPLHVPSRPFGSSSDQESNRDLNGGGSYNATNHSPGEDTTSQAPDHSTSGTSADGTSPSETSTGSAPVTAN